MNQPEAIKRLSLISIYFVLWLFTFYFFDVGIVQQGIQFQKLQATITIFLKMIHNLIFCRQ